MSFLGSILDSPYNVPAADGVYGYKAPVASSSVGNITTSTVVLYGPATWGKANVPIVSGTDDGSLWDAIGGSYPLVNGQPYGSPLLEQAMCAADPGFALSSIVLVPQRDGTETAAQMPMVDTTGAQLGFYIGISEGTRGNSGQNVSVPSLLSTTTSPLYDVTLTIANGSVERFASIIAYATVGGGYNKAAFLANLSAAVNSGVGGSRGPSRYWVWLASGAGAGAPAAAPQTASGGTDGASGLTTAIQLGSSSQGATSGLAAAQQYITGATFGVCGLTDPASFPSQEAFAKANLAMGIYAFPAFTTTTNLIATKTANAMLQSDMITVKKFVNIFDRIMGQVRLVSSMGFSCAMQASRAPEESFANKVAATLILSVEDGTSPNVSEASQLSLSGTTYWKQVSGQFVMANGNNASGAQDATGQANFVRMSNFIMLLGFAVLQPYLEALQGDDADEDTIGTRAQAKKALETAYGNLKRARRISGYKVTLDASNNQPATTDVGEMFATSQLAFLKTIRRIVNSVDASGTLTGSFL